MFYYKIINLIKLNGQCDYKGLNTDLFFPRMQVYPKKLELNNMCLIVSTENIKSTGDLEQITEEEYLKLKSEIEEENKKDIPQGRGEQNLQERISALERSNAEMMNLIATMAAPK